jgi:alpha-ketoglutarate-dependent taurine dioxygenase
MSTAPADLLDRPHAQEFTVRPIQPTIGAEISDIDISRPLSLGQRDALKAAILKHKVVFFRDQTLTAEQHANFARQFGPLYTHPSTKRDEKIAPTSRCSFFSYLDASAATPSGWMHIWPMRGCRPR